MTRPARWIPLLTLPAALLAGAAFAQLAPPSPDQKDMAIDAKARATVLDTLIRKLHDNYVFPPVADALDKNLRMRQKRGDFDRITSAQTFADTLSTILREVGKDRHFRVGYREEPIPMMQREGPPPESEMKRFAELGHRLNYGFEGARRLAGNVGYLDLRSFQFTGPEAGAAANAAMNLLANTDALIIDVRRNGGGSPEMVQLVSTYLFEGEDRTHLNDLVWREGGSERVDQFYTLPWVPGPRNGTRPVYVLTSRNTGSAAEEFTYNLKNLKRATIVGDTTAGAANPGGFVRLHEHFAAFISNGRARSPITKTNWEGVGVIPDVRTSADDALKTAHTTAIKLLMDKAADPEQKSLLQRALTQAEAAPVEPLDVPRRRR